MTDEDQHPSPGWHLDRKVPISIIITLVSLAGAGMSAYGGLRRDIELLKADALVLHQQNTQQNNDLDKAITVMQANFQRMDAKLDRLIERSKP